MSWIERKGPGADPLTWRQNGLKKVIHQRSLAQLVISMGKTYPNFKYFMKPSSRLIKREIIDPFYK